MMLFYQADGVADIAILTIGTTSRTLFWMGVELLKRHGIATIYAWNLLDRWRGWWLNWTRLIRLFERDHLYASAGVAAFVVDEVAVKLELSATLLASDEFGLSFHRRSIV